MYRVAFGLLLACVVLRCGVSVWIVVECVGFAFGVLWGCLGFLLVCREIAKVIKSVIAITELKKIAKKRCKLLKLLELLGYLLALCFGIFWQLLALVSLGFVVGSLKRYRLTYPTAGDSTRAIFRD